MTVDAATTADVATVDEGDASTCSIPAAARSDNPDGPGGCAPNLDWTSSLWCTSSQYELLCFGTTMGGAPSPKSSLGCTRVPAADPGGGDYYCCPCQGPGATVPWTVGASCNVPPQALRPSCSVSAPGGACKSFDYQLTCDTEALLQAVAHDVGCTSGPNGVNCCPCQTCVDIDVSTYDQSCTKSEDCMAIASEKQCNWGCLCPNASVNVSGAVRYEQTIAELPDLGDCGCPAERFPCCVDGQCVTSQSRCADADPNPVDGGSD